MCNDVLQSAKCVIGGTCYSTGDKNPVNLCNVCTPPATTTWSLASTNADCTTDALACTDQKCDANGNCQLTVPSGCSIDGACYAANARNPSNSCQQCVPGTSKLQWTSIAPGAACTDDGLTCTTDTCDSSVTCQHTLIASKCLISGTCYDSGVPNPAQECQTCNPGPGGSTTAFSNKTNNTACTPDAAFCTEDKCTDGVCTHPNLTDTSPCDDGNACSSNDQCISGVCGGSVYACPSCKTCDGLGECTLLANKCFISGACYDSGAVKPLEGCSACNPNVGAGGSTSSWSVRPVSTVCYDFPTGTPGTGACLAGTCDGSTSVCGGDVGPVDESGATLCCNGIDDDCDGLQDAPPLTNSDPGCVGVTCP